MTIGFRIKLHHAFIAPILLAGVPRRFGIVLWTICAAFVLGMQAWYVFPLFLIIHIIVALMVKHDPHLIDVVARHIHQKKYYDV